MNTMLQKHGLVGVIPHDDLYQKESDMSGRRICAVAADRGGFNALEPVLLLALARHCAVRLFLAGTCREQYESKTLLLDPRIEVTTGTGFLPEMDAFLNLGRDILLIGASQSAEGTVAARNAIVAGKDPKTPRAQCLTIGIEDMYKSMLPTMRSSGTRFMFDRLCVIDEYARKLILDADPRMEGRIVVTGGPQFDAAVEVKKNWAEHRSTIRTALKVQDDALVFLLAGGVNGSAEMLQIVYRGIDLAGVGDRAKVILRKHSRATAEDRDTLRSYLSEIPRTWFAGEAKDVASDINDLLPGVDIVVSGFSTVNHLAILYEMPGTVYVGTPTFQKDLLAEKNLQRPPEVDAGAAWYVRKSSEMAAVIMALHPSHSNSQHVAAIRAAQHRIASYNDGKSAERVWGQMCELVNL